jgi:hypothetical protein
LKEASGYALNKEMETKKMEKVEWTYVVLGRAELPALLLRADRDGKRKPDKGKKANDFHSSSFSTMERISPERDIVSGKRRTMAYIYIPFFIC